MTTNNDKKTGRAPDRKRQVRELTEGLAELRSRARRLEEAWQDTMDEALHTARRRTRRGRRAVEDFTDDLAREVRRHPLRDTGIALGAGMMIGILGTLAARMRCRRTH